MTQLKPLAAITLMAALTACGNDSTSLVEPQQDAAAHWLNQDTILLNASDLTKAELVHTDKNGQQQTFALNKIALASTLSNKFPHLSDFSAYQLAQDVPTANLLKGQLKVEQYQTPIKAVSSRVQTYGVIDQLYTSGNKDADEVMDYGATLSEQGVQFKLWAPTATKVTALVFNQDKSQLQKLELTEDSKTGVWSGVSDKAKALDFYQYQVDVFHPVSGQFESLVVTDPYSLSLSRNSKYSQIIDLTAPQTQPENWQNHPVPVVAEPEDLLLYEMHIRDFSAAETKLSDPDFKGKYKAFSEIESNGIKHLNMLKQAGLNTLHLLPTYDLSTINEDPEQALDINDSLDKMCRIVSVKPYCDNRDIHSNNKDTHAKITETPTQKSDLETEPKTIRQLLSSFTDDTQAQDLMEQIRGFDNYNWGYDPYHYTVPEGSYAVNPEGHHRIVEFREMVQSIHEMGFRVIMDVVYNHTFASGLAEKSVLDKVVPGYYQRYHPVTGEIEMSTCCDNTATEHAMMEKLMTDSLVVWARDYKIDGFRFDLMGHQPKDAMLRARQAVQVVDPDSYFYGEGWNFGEVANNAQFVQASQIELAGTEIGTFTDRLRDAIRGGNFQTGREGLRRDQGIGNGLFVIPNDLQPEDKQYAEYLESMDQVRVGMAGNLKSFQITDINGNKLTGAQVNYGGSPAGYAEDPADTVNYVSKHDNQTLWDNNQYRMPYDMTSDDRVRVHSLSLAYPLLSQGIPFLHMGAELMRSKSFLRDSYDYGDWFNFVDFAYQSNNYDVGLPPAVKDQDNWPVISKLLAKNGDNDDVSPEQIKRSAQIFADFIKIRTSSKLFRLTSAQQIKQSLSFHNMGKAHIPGLIVMELSDQAEQELDPNYQSIVVIFNNDDEAKHFNFTAADYQLHPAQLTGHDEVVKTAKADATGFAVPALTVAVFVK